MSFTVELDVNDGVQCNGLSQTVTGFTFWCLNFDRNTGHPVWDFWFFTHPFQTISGIVELPWRTEPRYFFAFHRAWSFCNIIRHWAAAAAQLSASNFKASFVAVCRIWDSHSGGYEELYLLGYNTLQSVESQPTFRRNISLPSLVSKNEPSKKPELK
jgi:hypothetical protein